MSKTPVSPLRDRWARLRFSIIGPLLAAPPLPQQLHAALTELSAKTWRDPDGLDVQFGVSTLERWYYAARRADDPVAILRNRVRADIGRFPSMPNFATHFKNMFLINNLQSYFLPCGTTHRFPA